MRNHTMSCDYPEGCSCGATEWNRLETELAAALTAKQRAETNRALRLMADVVTLRKVLEVAQLWLCNCMPIVEIKGPKPLPLIAEALATDHPGATLVSAVGKAHAFITQIHNVLPSPESKEALALLEPWAKA